MAAITFVVIERDQQDDDPDDVVNVWVFADEASALDHAKGMEARSEASWRDWMRWQWRDNPHVLQKLFGPLAEPHFGPEPSRDDHVDSLEVFRCEPGVQAQRIWVKE